MARKLSNWLRYYLEYTSTSEAPDIMHFWTGVSTIAGALRRRVWFDQGHFKWYPNFYIIFVAKPGVVKKTTTLNIGHNLLKCLKDIIYAPSSSTWQKLYKFMADNETTFTIMNGATPIVHKMSAVTAAIGELETFLKLKDEGFNGAMIDLYDGNDTSHSTVGGVNADIKNPWLNLIGATTPSWIEQNIPIGMIEGGLFSRVIFICAAAPRFSIAYPKYEQRPDQSQLRDALIHDLQLISTLYGEMVPTLELREWGQQWYLKRNETRSLHLASSRYDGYYERKQSHVHKLAMVLHLAESSTLELTVKDVEAAIQMIEVAEKSLSLVFEGIGMVDEAKRVSELVSYVKAHKHLTSQQLWSFVRNIMKQSEFSEACKAAYQSGQLTYTVINNENHWILPGAKP